MQKNILFGIVGLIIGLSVGFFAANKINRSAVSQQNTSQPQIDSTSLNRQVQSSDIKEQTPSGKPLPEVSEKIDKARNEPGNFDAQMQAGNLYIKIQALDKAGEFFQRAEQLNPSDYEKIVLLGNAFFDVGNFEKAENWYQLALAKKPDDVNVRTDLGITFVERKNPDLERAVKEFQTSLQTNARHEPTLYNLGIAYFKKGDSEKARETLKQLEAVNEQSSLAKRLRQIIDSE